MTAQRTNTSRWRSVAAVLLGHSMVFALSAYSTRHVAVMTPPRVDGVASAVQRASRPQTDGQDEGGASLSAVEGVLPEVKRIFRQHGVPPGLVWMAEVESSWNARAVSPAGAVGLFQFMPETGQRFGLKRNPYDERLHPYKSARAAAEYLRVLYDRFGSWRLALAAYNAGEGRVSRAMAVTPDTTFDQLCTWLPSETRTYVERVLQTVQSRERPRAR